MSTERLEDWLLDVLKKRKDARTARVSSGLSGIADRIDDAEMWRNLQIDFPSTRIVNDATDEWRTAVAMLNKIQKSFVTTTLHALGNQGVNTVREARMRTFEQLLSYPNIGEKRAEFLKTMFPLPKL